MFAREILENDFASGDFRVIFRLVCELGIVSIEGNFQYN